MRERLVEMVWSSIKIHADLREIGHTKRRSIWTVTISWEYVCLFILGPFCSCSPSVFRDFMLVENIEYFLHS